MNDSTNILENQYDLTQSQKMLWAGQQLSPFSPMYNMAFTYRFSVGVNEEKFRQAFQKLIQQSDVLRSRFIVKDGVPQQLIRKELVYEMSILDFSNQANQQIAIEEWSNNQVQNILTIDDILFESVLLKLGETDYIWYLNQHHLITDGWSVTIQYERMMNIYQTLLKDELNTEDSPPQFVDYIQYEAKKRLNKSTSTDMYWKEKVNSLPEYANFYSKQNPLGNTLIHRNNTQLDKEKTKQLRELVKTDVFRTWSEDLSMFLFFQTALYLTMLKVTGQSKLTIGTPIHNRNQPNFKKTVGVFIELFPIHVELEAKDTFISLYEKVRDEYYQFMRYAQTGCSSPALGRKYNVIFNYINASYPENEAMPMQSHWLDSGHADPEHHLRLQIFNFDNSEAFQILLDGNTAIFTTQQMNQLTQYFMELVDGVLENQALSIKDIFQSTAEEIGIFNQTEKNYPQGETVVSLFEKKVKQTPDATVLIFENQKLSFRELDKKTNQLAHHLLSLGVEQEDLVVICLDRSMEMMIGLMGIIKSGAAYVPIDPEYPKNRIDDILEDTQSEIVVCQNKYVHFFEGDDIELIVLDKDWEGTSQLPTIPVNVQLTPQNLMYVIYTSGSTGKPKGVMNEYIGVVNRLLWGKDYFEVEGMKEVVLQKTTYCFDVSVWELFYPLITGGTLVFSQPDGHKDSRYLRNVINEREITMIHFVPPMLEVFLLGLEEGSCPNLKKVICSGEELKAHQVQLFQEKLPHVELYNLYGPTEAAIEVIAYQVPKDFGNSQIVPIGKPVANTQIYILNSLGMPCPVGVVGELYIGGIQVARGYYRRPELTKDRFVKLDFLGNKKLYKSGDAASWLADGNIQFLGRLDTQVKIRGFRVETSEIESVLNQIQGVQQSVVLAKKDNFGNKYLIGYFVGSNDISKTTILENLKSSLPTYMIPSHLIELEELPLNFNGKIDRKALPLPESNTKSDANYIAPSNEIEEIIQTIWEEVLEIEKISVSNNFFEIGGESLKAIRVVSRLSAELELELSVNVIFQKPTISQLAEHIEEIITKLLQELEED